ncbi:MAG: MBOAT family protein [Oscillospiraceae bacterium]|nr:MBOAT family protein [Oscillospiraceae bacterium]
MVFSSFHFLFWFLPFCLIVYALARKKERNLVLLFFSIVFYAYGAMQTPFHLYLILISVVVNWVLGVLMEQKRPQKKLWLMIGLIWDFGCLFVFKYTDFFIKNLNHLPLVNLPLTNLVLPLGISFFTFQIASYLIDVYRGTVRAEYSLIDLGTYILMFPQLIAGPIVRFSDVQKELHNRRVRQKEFVDGLYLFIIGLGRKVMLANMLSYLWNDLAAVGYESISTPAAWMGIFAYSMQLYFDFSGYSQMAIGMGLMLGFHFPQNFNHPYLSTSMTEFWRRWHMTLGGWFREYVYIPLGGNRCSKQRMYFNMFVVWTLTGFWHGADWNFILWGMLLFCLLAVEKAGLGKWLSAHKGIAHLYMIFWIPVSWALFAITDLKQVGIFIGRLFGIGGEVLMKNDYVNYFHSYGKFLILGLLFCTAAPQNLYRMLRRSKHPYAPYVTAALMLAILGGSCYCLYKGMNNPFMYFQF